MGEKNQINILSSILAVIIVLSITMPIAMSNNSPEIFPASENLIVSDYTPHAPIRIDSNSDFTAQGWPGDGTEASPWKIENYEINGTGYGYCIYIGNTTDYFVVIGCNLYGANNVHNGESFFSGSGLSFYNVVNGKGEYNELSFNEAAGIFLEGSTFNTFSYNNLSNNDEGSYLRYSSNNNFSYNTCSNAFYGLSLFYSDSNSIYSNEISNSYGGIYYLESSNNLALNNSIFNNTNGLYLKDSSNNNMVNDNIITNNSNGIFMDRCDLNFIVNNIFFNNGFGVQLSRSTDITMVNNMMINCGIFIEGYMDYYWNSHDINSSNMVNGKPVYYWKNQNNGFIPAGAGQIILANCNDVFIENQDVSNSTVGIELGFSENISINNIITLNNFYGIYLYYSDNTTISNSTVSNNWNGIYFAEDCNSNILITSIISSNELYGIYISHSDNNTIGNNAIENNIYGIFSIISNDNIIANNSVSDNTDGIKLSGSKYHTILNNTISNNDIGICVSESSQCNLSYNSMVNNGILFQSGQLEQWNSHDIDTSNRVNGKRVYYLKNQIEGTIPAWAGQVILANCSYIHIENQNFINATCGIQIGFSSKIVISNIRAYYNTYAGIYLKSSFGNSISHSTFYSNVHGIYVHNSYGNLIEFNNASNNERGIYLNIDYTGNSTFFSTDQINDDYSTNYIENNDVMTNGVGIELYNSYNYVIAYNVISNNSLGIYLESATGGTGTDKDNIIFSPSRKIYHNYFIDNTIQANDSIGTIWDDGYPSGGNYWSDYTGIDMFSGPGQDEPGSDGIGDTPYDINEWKQDNYPLMAQLNFTISLTSGWNLISLPLRQDNTTIATVLNSIAGQYDVIKYYDATDVSDPWKTCRVGVSTNDLMNIDNTMGFWLNVTNSSSDLEIYGTEPISTNIILKAGWNLVGYPSLFSETVAVALWGTGADSVEACDLASPYLISVVGPDYIMQPGEGYWVHVPADTVWTVP